MSIRNNEERTGAALDESSPILSQNLQDPLNFVVPTMHVDLPSRGSYYAKGHPLHGEDTVEIRFMTAKDEDILTSPALIKKRTVLDRLLQSLILDKRVHVEDLLLGDKNAILIQARISGYGQWYEVKMNCPSCGEEQTEEFDLEECSTVTEGENDLEEVKKLENGNFLITLPRTKAECEVKLFRGHEEKILVKSMDKKGKNKDHSTTLTQQLKLMIESVNGYKDPKVIAHFVDHMPVADSRMLRYFYDKITPNINLTAPFECESCEYLEDVEVPLTVDFFWPKQ
jgi:hypothetical protein